PPACFVCCHPPLPGFIPLSLHDALPIYFYHPPSRMGKYGAVAARFHGHLFSCGNCDNIGLNPDWKGTVPWPNPACPACPSPSGQIGRHTSELQSRENLVCRLLLDKKNKK